MENLRDRLLKEHQKDSFLSLVGGIITGGISVASYLILEKNGYLPSNNYLFLFSLLGGIGPGVGIVEKWKAKRDLERANKCLIAGDYETARYFAKEILIEGSKKIKKEAKLILESIPEYKDYQIVE